jgi:3',5'-cyclic-nucleotide phosphodiesterase
MINSILATDMGVHFKYMEDLSALQRILKSDGKVVEGWDQDPKEKEKYRDLVCALLIKCADISNVVSWPAVFQRHTDESGPSISSRPQMGRYPKRRVCAPGIDGS